MTLPSRLAVLAVVLFVACAPPDDDDAHSVSQPACVGPPSAPVVAAGAVTPTSISLSWTLLETGVNGCRVYENGVRIAFVEQPASSHVATGLTPSTAYTFTVRCYDVVGTAGDISAPLTVTTAAPPPPMGPDVTPPTAATNLAASNVTGTSLRLTWTASTDTGSGVSGYRVYQDGVRIAFTTQLEYAVAGLAAGRAYVFQLETFDVAANRTPSAALTVTTPGAAAPPFGPPPAAPFTACTHYVSPSGNDSNAGTSLSAPWRTVAQANASLQPGQTVCLRAGAYDETIRPAAAGTASARITYAAYNAETVTLRGSTSNVQAADLSSRSYVTLYGLKLNSDKAGYNEPSVFAGYASGVELRYCEVRNPRPMLLATTNYWRNPWGIIANDAPDLKIEACVIGNWHVGIDVSRSSRAVIRQNVIQNNLMGGIFSTDGTGAIQGLLIEGNLIGGSLASDGIQTDDYRASEAYSVNVRGLVVRRNIFYWNAENAIDLKAGGDVVIEENIMVAAMGDNDGHGFQLDDQWWLGRLPGSSVMHGSYRTAGRAIIRHNVIYDSTGVSQLQDGWHVFNNTFVNNNRDFTGANSTWADETVFIANFAEGYAADWFNNVVVNHNHGAVWFWGAAPGTVWDHNLYFESGGAPVFIVRPPGADKDRPSQQFVSFSAFKAALPSSLVGRDANSLVADPQFTSVPSRPVFPWTQPNPAAPVVPPAYSFASAKATFPYDFTLRSTSPAVDHGRHLTTTTNQGPSTSLQVRQAGYFFDGYGVVSGDLIRIGSQAPVEITGVNYATNTLTLRSARTWQPGDTVDLAYAGAAPDLGACEHTANMPLCVLPP